MELDILAQMVYSLNTKQNIDLEKKSPPEKTNLSTHIFIIRLTNCCK